MELDKDKVYFYETQNSDRSKLSPEVVCAMVWNDGTMWYRRIDDDIVSHHLFEYAIETLDNWLEAGMITFISGSCQVHWIKCAECNEISYNDYLCQDCRISSLTSSST